MSIVIWLLTFVLVLLSVFLVLVVLMQKSKSDGGVGAALGGGMTEATFGAESGNMLATLTRNCTIAFFVLSFGLYLMYIHQHHADDAKVTLPTIPGATEEAAPAAPEAAESAAPQAEVPAVAPAPGEASVVLPDATPEAEAPAAPAATEPAK